MHRNMQKQQGPVRADRIQLFPAGPALLGNCRIVKAVPRDRGSFRASGGMRGQRGQRGLHIGQPAATDVAFPCAYIDK